MSLPNIFGGKIAGAMIQYGWKAKVNTETLGGAKTLAANDYPVQFLDPGGAARTVTLPAEADSEGLIFVIFNEADAAEDITVENDATATVATVSQNEGAVFICDGTTWHGLVGGIT